ncbi:hemerythrin domain-containing protein [Kineococcus auxinigenes]|uniref:hemerythrin domain-containing protein n=1 Tax=unclassified Kineococcus TaxID=2621656 RepID=UPI003D7EDEDE
MCSYCGCRDITLIGQLNAEHDAIVNASGPLQRAVDAGDSTAALELLDVLEGLLHPHTALEERGLFTELRRDPDFSDHVDALCREHDDLDAGFAACRGGDWSGLQDLLFMLREHIEKEENGLFPAALTALDGDQWERLHADPAVGAPHGHEHPHDHDHLHAHAHG